MRKRHRKNGNKKFVYILSFSLVFLFSIGYAAFNTTLSIKGKGNIKIQDAAGILKRNVVTSGDGLYADTYEEGRFIYRGKSPNNYIEFSGSLWRIVAVEKDKSLKIIKDESIGKMPYDERTTSTSGPRLNENNTYCRLHTDGIYYGCNAWAAVTGTFTNGTSAGTVKDNSSLNNYLNGEYYTSLSDKQYIINHDFIVGGAKGKDTNAGIVDQQNTEREIIWNGKIGLLRASDYLKSNSLDDCIDFVKNSDAAGACANTNYLVNDTEWWTSSIRYNEWISVWRIITTGLIYYYSPFSSNYFVRPVVFLTPNITLTGNGTIENPYKLKAL